MSPDRQLAAVASIAHIDLRRASLADIQSVDFRTPERDFWTDEAAVWDRFAAVWAGLDDAARRLPGAAPPDARGADWSFLDHVAHVLDWLQIRRQDLGPAVARRPLATPPGLQGRGL